MELNTDKQFCIVLFIGWDNIKEEIGTVEELF